MYLHALHENCSGCRTCLLACALENFQQVRPSLALLRIQGLFTSPGRYHIHLCDQCGTCAEVCPVGAITWKSGVYRVNQETCTQCLECVQACPFGVICYHPDLEAPFKCVLCGACVQACPREAIVLIDEPTKGEVACCMAMPGRSSG